LAHREDVSITVVQLSGHTDEGRRRVFRRKLARCVGKPDRDLIIAVNGEGIGAGLVRRGEEWAKERGTAGL